MICQFYATLEVHSEDERLIWMTGTRRVKATYRDLATAVRLDHRKMKRGKLIVELPMLLAGDVDMPELYY